MKKSFYTQTIKALEHWTGVQAEVIDTSKFRRANDLQYKLSHKEWFVLADYNQSDDDNAMRRVADRSLSLYYRENRKDMDIDRSVHIYENDSDARYTHNVIIDVRVNNVCVAYFVKQIDLFDNEGKVWSKTYLADLIGGLVFRP